MLRQGAATAQGLHRARKLRLRSWVAPVFGVTEVCSASPVEGGPKHGRGTARLVEIGPALCWSTRGRALRGCGQLMVSGSNSLIATIACTASSDNTRSPLQTPKHRLLSVTFTLVSRPQWYCDYYKRQIFYCIPTDARKNAPAHQGTTTPVEW